MPLPLDDLGDGPPVVLLHAGAADRRMWADVMPAIAAAGYRAIALDLPGYGDATDPAAPPDTAVVETMQVLGIEPAVLVGNSFGGAVAQRVAVVAPERVAAIVLVSAPAEDVEPSAELEAAWEAEESAVERGDLDAAVQAVLDTWTLPDASQALRERLATMQRRAYELAPHTGELEFDDPLEADPSALTRVDVPALVAVGEHDMRDYHLGAESLARQLPQARHVVIPGAGHLAPLEQPDAFLELLLDFLRTLPA